MITSIDANGRVQLPLTIRYWLDLCPGDKIAVDHLGDGTIILKKIEFHPLMVFWQQMSLLASLNTFPGIRTS